MKEIELTQGKVAFVDDEDFEKVNQYRWRAVCFYGNWYAMRHIRKSNGGKTTQRMHRFIINAPDKMQVDHHSHNGLDNRKNNLRICTNAQNLMNQKPRQLGTTSSKFKGVCWHKASKKWQAQIRLDGKLIHLGLHTNEITAALAYNIKATELFNDFAYLNFQ